MKNFTNWISKIKGLVGERRMAYTDVLDLAAAMIRCLYTARIQKRTVKRRTYYEGYHLGKAFAYLYALSRMGYTNVVHPLGLETLGEEWQVLNGTYMIGGNPGSFVVKRQLFEDAMRYMHDRHYCERSLGWDDNLLAKIKKDLQYAKKSKKMVRFRRAEFTN